MENASKALLMAAGVLIGILTLSLAVYLFVSFGSTSAEIYKKNEENQLNQFNTQFTSYVGTDITIHDVITVANLATENNVFYELPETTATGKDNYISVYLKGTKIEFGYEEGRKSTVINSKYNGYIKKDIENMQNGELKKYKCTVKISPTTQRVFRVEFEEKN